MDTGEYGRIIKEEVESAGDEHEIISKEVFELKHIKSEDVIDFDYHDLKSEKFGLCGGGLLSPRDFFSPDSLKSCCNYQCKNESNAMQGEDMAQDFKPPSFSSDSGNFHFKIPEETLVVKEEMANSEDVPSTLYEKEISIESFHVNHETLLKTEEVDETFESGYYLNSVGQSIQEENEICSKNLNEKTNLENRPIKKIPFFCKVCTKSFRKNCDLKRHEKIHTGEKPFHCEICPKSFIQGGDFKRHEKIHTGEKPFQCKICSKSFTLKRYLKMHEKIHTGEKPFQCKICSKSFIQVSNFKRHEKIHAAEKPFQCEICPK